MTCVFNTTRSNPMNKYCFMIALGTTTLTSPGSALKSLAVVTWVFWPMSTLGSTRKLKLSVLRVTLVTKSLLILSWMSARPRPIAKQMKITRSSKITVDHVRILGNVFHITAWMASVKAVLKVSIVINTQIATRDYIARDSQLGHTTTLVRSY